jgi:RNA polymerase sigma-70 factor (ECF subfamily)
MSNSPNRLSSRQADIVSHAFTEHSDGLLAYFKKRYNPDQAEDIVQAAYERFMRDPDRHDPTKSSQRSYLQLLGNRAAIDMFRTEASRTAREVKVGTIAHLELQVAPDPASLVIADEGNAAALGLLTMLSEKKAAVLIPHIFNDEPQSVLADELGIPYPTLKTRVRDGLGEIRNALSDQGYTKVHLNSQGDLINV